MSGPPPGDPASEALRRHLAPPEPSPGLCGACAHVRVVRSGKGSTFYLCEMSRVDPAFPRYPRLPVLRCRGYAPAETSPGTGP